MDAGERDRLAWSDTTVPGGRRDDVGERGELRLGDKLGRFEIVKQLGAGGMGVVYVALDPTLNRQVAVKLLRLEKLGPLGAADARSRLLREAQAMARLSHPNVITVHEIGSDGDDVFVVMELNDGKNLTEWLKTKPTWQGVVRVFIEAGEGLAAAHRAKMIHRDFKPDNVLIGRDGRVRVTDFGLVDLLSKPPGQNDPSKPRISQGGMLGVSLTQTGEVLGTPPYMAPEQHDTRPADERTDQYSFSVSLFEALYGTRPFVGARYRDLVVNILEGNRSPVPTDTDVPSKVGDIVLRGLAREANQRFASMADLLGELREALANPEETVADAATPTPAATHAHEHTSRRRWPAIALSVGIATALAVAIIVNANGGEVPLWAAPVAAPLSVDAGVAAGDLKRSRQDAAPFDAKAREPKAAGKSGTKPALTTPSQAEPPKRVTKPPKTDTKPAETKPAETKPTETKPTETKPTETKPTEKPAETKPTEAESAADKRRRELDLDFGGKASP